MELPTVIWLLIIAILGLVLLRWLFQSLRFIIVALLAVLLLVFFLQISFSQLVQWTMDALLWVL